MRQQNILLLNDASATGETVKVAFGGDYCFAVAGNFGGATVGLQMLGPDEATWISVKDANGDVALTAADAVIASLPAGQYRATISGGAGVSVSGTLRNV